MQLMSLISKILKRPVLDPRIGDSIIIQRGNLDKEFPSDFSDDEKKNIGAVRSKTMTSLERLVSLSRSIDYLVANKIKGDFVECGVWKGGSMMLAASRLIQHKDTSRKLFLFDTYEGMSEPSSADVSSVDHQTAAELLTQSERTEGNNVWCYSSLDEVKQNLVLTGYPESNMHFVKGKVEETLPHPSINQIALLRLDTDWYESTRHELETMYDLVVPGGIIIVDDYGHWRGSKQAVDEFLLNRGLSLMLTRIDYTGRLIIKP
jgi:O-methyltransferase